ncbi:vWA domain-containing protein [Endozoicomonadaceae bacterium StTr2]
MFELHWPWMLALIPVPLLIWKFVPAAPEQRQGALWIPFYSSLQATGLGSASNRSHPKIRLLMMSLIWLGLVLAAARPQWIGEPLNLPTSGRDLMLAVDLSGSMQVEDMTLKGGAVDRLTVTKDVVNDFILRRQGDRLGLILFGSQAYLQTPLTYDLETVKQLLDESVIGLAGKYTAIGDAIGLSVKHLRQRPADSRVLILLTDGANTTGEISPLQAARLAEQENIKIYTIGIGADEMVQPGFFGSAFGARKVNPSADLDEKTLTEIAKMTGGKYFRAKNREQLVNIYADIDQLEPVAQEDRVFRPTRSLYFWPLGISLVLSFMLALGQVITGLRSNPGAFFTSPRQERNQ